MNSPEFRAHRRTLNIARETKVKGKVPVFVYTGNGEEKKIDAEVPSTPHEKGQQGYWQ